MSKARPSRLPTKKVSFNTRIGKESGDSTPLEPSAKIDEKGATQTQFYLKDLSDIASNESKGLKEIIEMPALEIKTSPKRSKTKHKSPYKLSERNSKQETLIP